MREREALTSLVPPWEAYVKEHSYSPCRRRMKPGVSAVFWIYLQNVPVKQETLCSTDLTQVSV